MHVPQPPMTRPATGTPSSRPPVHLPAGQSSRLVQRGPQQVGKGNVADDGSNEIGVQSTPGSRYVHQAGPVQHGKNNRARGTRNRVG